MEWNLQVCCTHT